LGSDLTLEQITDINADGFDDIILRSEDGRILSRFGDERGEFAELIDHGTGFEGGAIRKIYGGENWNAGAHSTQSYDGGVAFTTVAQQINRNLMIGLSADAGGSGYKSIDFAILQHSNGYLYIYENGVKIGGHYGRYHVGDTLSIERSETGEVTYLRNGDVFYTSATVSSPDIALLVDASVRSVGAAIGTTQIISNGITEDVIWVRDASLEYSLLPQDQTSEFDDVNADGLLDLIIDTAGDRFIRLQTDQFEFDSAITYAQAQEQIAIFESGTDADELLIGTIGDDRINGAAGNDTIVGGAGQDVLTGGAGADVFEFSSLLDSIDDNLENNNQYDRIEDFEVGIDKVDLRGLGFTGIHFGGGLPGENELRLSFSENTGRSYLIDDNSDFIFYLQGDYRDSLSESDFLFT